LTAIRWHQPKLIYVALRSTFYILGSSQHSLQATLKQYAELNFPSIK